MELKRHTIDNNRHTSERYNQTRAVCQAMVNGRMCDLVITVLRSEGDPNPTNVVDISIYDDNSMIFNSFERGPRIDLIHERILGTKAHNPIDAIYNFLRRVSQRNYFVLYGMHTQMFYPSLKEHIVCQEF